MSNLPHHRRYQFGLIHRHGHRKLVLTVGLIAVVVFLGLAYSAYAKDQDNAASVRYDRDALLSCLSGDSALVHISDDGKEVFSRCSVTESRPGFVTRFE